MRRAGARKAAFELGTPAAVTGDEDDEIRKTARRTGSFPSANRSSICSTASMTTSKSSSAVQLVGLTMNPTGPEPRMPSARTALANLLARGSFDGHKRRGWPVVRTRTLVR
jgi:hypothetical protein